MAAPIGSEVWVALQLPYSDRSGETAVLGVYRTQALAQARCYRHQADDRGDCSASPPVVVVAALIDHDLEAGD